MIKRLLLGVVLCGGLLLMIGAGVEARRLQWEQSWPTTTAEIVGVRFFESPSSAWLEVDYTFAVGGEVITRSGTVSAPGWNEVPASHRPGERLTVHYLPDDPHRAYVEHPGYSSPVILAILGGVIWLICLPFVLWYGLLSYIDLLQRKAEHHLREGLREILAGQDEVAALRNAGEEISPELQQREDALLAQAHDLHATLNDLKARRASLE